MDGEAATLKPTKPPPSGADESSQTPPGTGLGALSVLANSETTLSAAVMRSMGASFNEFYTHPESIFSQVGSIGDHGQGVPKPGPMHVF